ncbi:MAG TPA: hypothetical protein VMW27_01345 [Thermoanaerobaculia bacterium]|nr:hypothetical protein [Thermoanaerobaculia bacterium]
MAEHVWSVLCEKLLREDETGVISLVSVLERINLHEDLVELERQLEGASGFIHPMRLVVWCVRSDYDQPESFTIRLSWHLPTGDILTFNKEHQLSLETATGVRPQILLPGVPWRGPGLYWLVIEIKNEGQEWTTATRLPLEVVVLAPPVPSTEEAAT